MYWVDEGKEEQKIAELVTGTGTSSNTYIGHVFVVRKADDNQFLGYHIVNSAHDEYHLEDDEGFNPSETEFADKVPLPVSNFAHFMVRSTHIGSQ